MAQKRIYDRKTFIKQTSLALTGSAIVSALPGNSWSATPAKKVYTVQDIIDMLIKPVPGAPFATTVDTLKSGKPEQQVRGIVTTMFATVQVIREAVARGANFIIAHEPTFYNHEDDKEWAGVTRTVREKIDLLEHHQVAVWRFHDYQHAYQPDQTKLGVLQALGWGNRFDWHEGIATIPETSLSVLIQHLKQSLQVNHLRYIGDPGQRCSRIALLPGAAGGQRQIQLVEQTQPDVFVCGELREWETAEFVRDSRLLGRKTALVVLGHVNSEEPGMELLSTLLRQKLTDIPVSHIRSGSPFAWA